MNETIKNRIEQIRRGEVPEGYKRTISGTLPLNWRVEQLRNYLHEHVEFSSDTGAFPVATSSREGLILQSEYFQQQRFDETRLGYHVVPQGYITYRHMSDDNIFHFNINTYGQNVLVSPEYPVFAVKPSLQTSLLVEYLNSSARFLYYCRAQKKGSTRTRLYFRNLQKFHMPIPPSTEQQKIAEILMCCDQIISLKEQLLEEKRRQKKWLMQTLLDPENGTKRLKFFQSKWTKTTLLACSKGKGEYGINAPACEYSIDLPRYIRITDIDLDGRFTDADKVSVSSKDSQKYLLYENDLLFVRTGATVGKSYLYKKKDGVLVFAGFLIRFRINTEIANPRFVQAICNTYAYRNWVSTMSARSGQPGINAEEYGNLGFYLPEARSEQDTIVAIFIAADHEIDLLEQELSQWQQKKKALMQLLLTGIVRVNV